MASASSGSGVRPRAVRIIVRLPPVTAPRYRSGRERGECVLRDRRIHGRGEVRQGVGEGAVEIEEHRFDGVRTGAAGRAGERRPAGHSFTNHAR